jgi:hypothetical protein
MRMNIIATRIKKVLLKIISKNYGEFMQNRQIIDNIMLFQDDIHSSKENKEKGTKIILDMANAFNQVRYSFLFLVMSKLWFSPSFIKWISSCVSTPWIVPLVNGCPTSLFQGSKGLRQGCPMSPI